MTSRIRYRIRVIQTGICSTGIYVPGPSSSNILLSRSQITVPTKNVRRSRGLLQNRFCGQLIALKFHTRLIIPRKTAKVGVLHVTHQLILIFVPSDRNRSIHYLSRDTLASAVPVFPFSTEISPQNELKISRRTHLRLRVRSNDCRIRH